VGAGVRCKKTPKGFIAGGKYYSEDRIRRAPNLRLYQPLPPSRSKFSGNQFDTLVGEYDWRDIFGLAPGYPQIVGENLAGGKEDYD
jgi:hypothetical protein